MDSRTEGGDMSHGRALLTDAERRHISRQSDNEQLRYEAVWRARKRVTEELSRDVEILEEHHPELLEELREVVCVAGADTG